MSHPRIWACPECRAPLADERPRALHPRDGVRTIVLKPTGALLICPACGARLQWPPHSAIV